MTDERPPVAARPAAAVTLARTATPDTIEVFLVRRHVRSDFVPDAFVFPGGSVQPTDSATETTPGLCAPPPPTPHHDPTALGAGFRVAALREMFEEAGILLATRRDTPLSLLDPAARDEATRFTAYRAAMQGRAPTLTLADLATRESLTLRTDALLHWAHWITPPSFPKRFDTHFFLAEAPAGQTATHDALETTDGVWITPDDALERFARGAFPLVFATIHQLRALSGLHTIAEAQARFSAAPPVAIMPRVVLRDGVEVILLPDEQD